MIRQEQRHASLIHRFAADNPEHALAAAFWGAFVLYPKSRRVLYEDPDLGCTLAIIGIDLALTPSRLARRSGTP